MLHLDCANGIAGDMTLAAMAQAGESAERVREVVRRLGVGADVRFEQVGSGLRAHVIAPPARSHRHLTDVLAIIDRGGLAPQERRIACAAFERLALAEAAAHGTSVEEVHFHEVGALDSIVDIVGSAVAFVALGVERATCSRVNLGSGTVRCEHGTLPVPAPAVARIFADVGSCTFQQATGLEMTTPTGAALLRTFVSREGMGQPPPEGVAVGGGEGIGTHAFPTPRPLRVTLIETRPARGGANPRTLQRAGV